MDGKELTPKNLLMWMRHRIAHDRIKASTLQLHRTYINKLFEWAKSMGYLEKNPLDPIPRVPVPVATRISITDDQYEALKVAANGTLWLGLLIAGWVTGARLSDISNMRWADLDLVNNTWTFVPQKTKMSGRIVELPLFGELLEHLKFRFSTHDELDPYVFSEARRLQARQDGSLQELFRDLRTKAGITNGITFHCFRHTRASRMLNSPDGVDPITAANILGLSSLNTLRGYVHTAATIKEKAMKL